MASATQPTPAHEIDSPPSPAEQLIDEQLARTQKQVWWVDFSELMLKLILATFVFLAGAILLDHWLVPGGMGSRTRYAVWLIGMAGAVGYVAVRIVPLLRHRIHPLYAAATIERGSDHSLKNSLINFLFFRNQRELPGTIAAALGDQAATDLTTVPVDDVVDRGALIRWGMVLLALTVLGGAYQLFSPKDPFTSAARILFPWADLAAPSRTQILEILPGNTTLFRGQTLQVQVKLRGVRASDEVALLYTTIDQQAVARPVTLTWSETDNCYVAQLPPGGQGVQQDLSYQIAAGDAKSASFEVKVSPAPTIYVSKVQYEYPEYTGLTATEVTNQGDLRAIEGTRVKLFASANQPIESASYCINDHLTQRRPLQVNGEEATTQLTLDLLDDRQTPRIRSYQLQFTNKQGESSQQPVRHVVEVLRDVPPQIELTVPKLPNGELAIDDTLAGELTAHDPDFALRRVVLKGEVQSRPVWEQIVLDQDRQGQVGAKFKLEPSRLRVRPGDELTFWAVAEDNREPERNQTLTARQTVRIVGPVVPANKGASDPAAKGSPDDANQEPSRDSTGGAGRSADSASENQEGGDQNQADSGKSNSAKGGESGKSSSESNSANDNSKSGEQGAGGSEGGANGQQGGDDSQKSSGQQGNSGGEEGKSGGQDGKSGGQDGKAGGQEGKAGGQEGKSGGQEGKSGGKQNTSSGGESGKQGTRSSGGTKSNQFDKSGAEDSDAFREILKHQQQQENGGKNSDGSSNANATQQQGGSGQQGSSGKSDGSAKSQTGQAPSGASGTGQQEKGGANSQQQSQPPGADPKSGDRGQDQQPGQNGNEKQPAGADESKSQTGKQQSAQNSQDNAGKSQSGNSGDAAKSNSGQPDAKGGQQGQSGQTQQGQASAGEQPKSNQQQGAQPNQQQSDVANQQTGSQTGQQGSQNQSKSGDEGKSDSSGQQQSKQADKTDAANKSPKGSPTQPDEADPSGQPSKSNESQSGKQQEAQSPSNNSRSSSTKGNDAGDRSGEGSQGGGQKSPSQGLGSAGENSSAEQGGGQSTESGQGDSGSRGGAGEKGNPSGGNSAKGSSPAGKQNSSSGGSDSAESSSSGSQSGGEKQSGAQSSADSGKQSPSAAGDSAKGAGSSGASPRNAGNQSSSSQSGASPNTSGTGNLPDISQGPVNPNVSGGGELAGPGDQANVEFARQRANLALEQLRHQMQKDQVDPELLKKLGWSKDDLAAFLKRWERMRQATDQPGAAGEEAKRELDDALRSLGLRPKGAAVTGNRRLDDQLHGMRETRRSQPPADFAEAYKYYQQGTARGREASAETSPSPRN